MINWYEVEAWAARFGEIGALTDIERQRIDLLAGIDAARKPLRGRVAAGLVRLGAKLDPKVVLIEESADGALAEGRLAAYLR